MSPPPPPFARAGLPRLGLVLGLLGPALLLAALPSLPAEARSRKAAPAKTSPGKCSPQKPQHFLVRSTYVVNNHARLRADGSSLVLFLPKIQTAEEAALWHDMISRLEAHLGLPVGTVNT